MTGIDKAMSALLNVYLARALYVAVALRIADYLSERPLTIKELADRTKANASYLERIMSALVFHGYFKMSIGHDKYIMNENSKALLSKGDDSIADWILFLGSRWRDLEKPEISVLSGRPYVDIQQRISLYDHLDADPIMDEIFYDGMAAWTKARLHDITATHNFSRYRNVVDIGCGAGHLLLRILHENPGMKGVFFDRKEVVDKTRARSAGLGVIDRCSFIDGDFRVSIPPGGDAYIMKMILRDWNDEDAKKILRNCRNPMGNAPLIIIDTILDKVPEHEERAVLIDLQMMFLFGGKIRMAREWAELFDPGFQVKKVTRIEGTPLFIIEVIRKSML